MSDESCAVNLCASSSLIIHNSTFIIHHSSFIIHPRKTHRLALARLRLMASRGTQPAATSPTQTAPTFGLPTPPSRRCTLWLRTTASHLHSSSAFTSRTRFGTCRNGFKTSTSRQCRCRPTLTRRRTCLTLPTTAVLPSTLGRTLAARPATTRRSIQTTARTLCQTRATLPRLGSSASHLPRCARFGQATQQV